MIKQGQRTFDQVEMAARHWIETSGVESQDHCQNCNRWREQSTNVLRSPTVLLCPAPPDIGKRTFPWSLAEKAGLPRLAIIEWVVTADISIALCKRGSHRIPLTR
jgi:hypothetical protein